MHEGRDAHPGAAVLTPKFEKDAQLTLSGATITEEQWAASIRTVPDVETYCPFCLGGQNLRSMCFALPDGSLSKRRRCKYCNKTMEASSAVIVLKGEKEFGQWVATYPDFWRTANHERFMRGVESLHKAGKFKPWEFWGRDNESGYRKFRPHKQLDEDGYAKPAGEPEDDFEREWKAVVKKHTGPDGKVDWKAMADDEEYSGKDDRRSEGEEFAQIMKLPDPGAPREFVFVHRETRDRHVVRGERLEADGNGWAVYEGETVHHINSWWAPTQESLAR